MICRDTITPPINRRNNRKEKEKVKERRVKVKEKAKAKESQKEKEKEKENGKEKVRRRAKENDAFAIVGGDARGISVQALCLKNSQCRWESQEDHRDFFPPTWS